jgi:glycosyltransferase involved in cell wall biosynthesis
MREKPLLTVVTPVSKMFGRLDNLESWLREVSAFKIQVVVIHDKQDEKTGPELRAIISQISNPDIRYGEGVYGNPGAARNAGIHLADGKWICFWDSDDQPLVSTFYAMVQLAENSESEVCIGEFLIFNEFKKLETQESTFSQDSARNLEEVALNPGMWRMAFRSEVVGKTRFANLRMGEDQLFVATIGIFKKVILFYPHVVYRYCVGISSQLTANKSAISDLVPILLEMRNLLNSRSDKNKTLISLMVARQLITLIKRGTSRARISALSILIGFLVLDLQGKSKVLPSMFRIIRRSKEDRVGHK